MNVKSEKSPRGGHCLVCDKGLGLFRRISGNKFCSKQHEEQYLADLRELAVSRLQHFGAESARTRSTAV